MNESLKSLLQSIAPFSDEELDKVLHLFTPETIKKDSYFCKAGRISDRIGFVQSGLLRSYFTIKDKETTSFFQTSGSLATALLSFLQMKPALENIQALEDSELLVISKKDLYKLYTEDWKWQQVGRIVIEQYYIKMEQWLIILQSQSAQERYEYFLKEYPELIQSVPLYYIASFLGMSPETLSRIRKTKL